MKANEAPEKIYCESDGLGNIVKVHNSKWPDDEAENIEYTRTDAFIEKACAEIEKRMLRYEQERKTEPAYYDGLYTALEDLRDDFINTLEVKEVDLDKEIDLVEDKYHGFESLSRADIIGVAKYFFELGLKVAQKGEPVSEDLEKVAELYTLDDSIKPWRNLTKEAFKAGAKWQKQQIMKDVVEVGEAHIVWVEDNGRAFPELDDSVNDMLMPGDISKHFKDGDKVWIYLTKEKLLYLEKDEEIKKVIIKE